MKKIFALLLCVLCVFSICGCGKSETGSSEKAETTNAPESPEDIAKKNAENIRGEWIVESIDKQSADTMADAGAYMTASLIFNEGKNVTFLSDGTFLSSIYNLEYKMVDDKFIFVYKGQTYGYDCELNGNTLILSTPNVISVTMKKK